MPTTQAEDKVQIRSILNVVVGKSAVILELLALEDKALLVHGNALLVLNLLFNSFNGVQGVDVKNHRLVFKSPSENLHRLYGRNGVCEGGK